MEESPEPSPFAAFAAPKRSAVEEFQQRQRRAAQSRRQMIACVLSSLVGAAGGATTCAAYDSDLDSVLAAATGAVLCAAIGSILGLVVGAMCFSAMSLTGARGRPASLDTKNARDPMAGLRGLMFAWSLIGVAIGATQGALAGLHWAGQALKLDPLGRWTMVGSIVGAVFAVGVWLYAMRAARRVEQ